MAELAAAAMAASLQGFGNDCGRVSAVQSAREAEEIAVNHAIYETGESHESNAAQ